MNHKLERRLITVIPVLLFIVVTLLVNARGPYYWSENFDPEYAYLLNSLNLLTFQAPHHTDHPGTTLQELGAAVIFVRWMIDGAWGPWQPLSEAVLSRPEDYLHAISVTLQAAFCGLLWAVGIRIWRRTGSLAAALTLQAGFLVFHQTLLALTRVSPEPLLMIAALALAIPLIPMMFEQQSKDSGEEGGPAMLTGAIVGFGIVTKLTFLPLAALILVFRSWRPRLRFGAAMLVSMAVFLLPVWGELNRIFGWTLGLATHQERYGRGEAGLPNVDTLIHGVHRLSLAEPLLFPLAAAVAAVLALLFLRGRQIAGDRAPWLRRALLAGLLGIGGVVLLTAKHYAAHYSLPALALLPLLVAAVVASTRRRTGRRTLAIPMAVLVLVAAGVVHNAWRIGRWTFALRRIQHEIWAQEQLLASRPDCLAAGVYRSSLPGFALHFGNFSSDWRHIRPLEKLYPEEIHFQVFSGNFEAYGFEAKNDEIRARLAGGECVLMQGSPEGMSRVRGVRFEPLTPGERQRVYELTGVADLRPDYAPSEGTVVISAARFQEGNVAAADGALASKHRPSFAAYRLSIPEGGSRALYIRYSSGGGQPVAVRLNGGIVTESACTGITGNAATWELVGVYRFQAGENYLRLERNGEFPAISRIAVAPVEEPAA